MDPSILMAAAGSMPNPMTEGLNMFKQYEQRKYDMKLYEKQRQDSLEFWSKQNEYNSPEQQMARLKKAGLNPHLVYGSGQAQTPAGALDNPAVPTTTPQRVEGGKNPLDAIMLMQQLNNAQVQNEILSEERDSKMLDNIDRIEDMDIEGVIDFDERYPSFKGINPRADKADAYKSHQRLNYMIAESTRNLTEDKAKITNVKLQREADQLLEKTELTKAQKDQARQYIRNLEIDEHFLNSSGNMIDYVIKILLKNMMIAAKDRK